MPSITVYRSSDPGAPTLTKSAGSFIAVLDACLRTGYGSKAGAGWTKPYTGTNTAVFRQGTGGQNRCVRIVNGAVDLSHNFAAAWARGYESMTAVSTGTGPFPTAAQANSNGVYNAYIHVNEPGSTDWIVRANSNWFDIVTDLAPTTESPWNTSSYLAFGEFQSLKSGDTYSQYLYGGFPNGPGNAAYLGGSAPFNLFIARRDTGAAGSILATALPMFPGECSYLGYYNSTLFPSGGGSMANRASSTTFMHRHFIMDSGVVRGILPGLWGIPAGVVEIGRNTTFSGSGDLAGRTFWTTGYLAGLAPIILEVSNTLDD